MCVESGIYYGVSASLVIGMVRKGCWWEPETVAVLVQTYLILWLTEDQSDAASMESIMTPTFSIGGAKERSEPLYTSASCIVMCSLVLARLRTLWPESYCARGTHQSLLYKHAKQQNRNEHHILLLMKSLSSHLLPMMNSDGTPLERFGSIIYKTPQTRPYSHSERLATVFGKVEPVLLKELDG